MTTRTARTNATATAKNGYRKGNGKMGKGKMGNGYGNGNGSRNRNGTATATTARTTTKYRDPSTALLTKCREQLRSG
jgi:hypothetical protein